MRVLFVCRANGGRSPMAEAVFNRRSGKNSAVSAGVEVAREGNVGKPANYKNVKVMKELGCNISKHRRRQLSRKMVASAGMVVFMASSKKLPSYLRNSKKLRLWRIPNPRGQSMAARRRIRDKISMKVKMLIKEIG